MQPLFHFLSVVLILLGEIKGGNGRRLRYNWQKDSSSAFQSSVYNDIDAFNIFSDVSTKPSCPPCAGDGSFTVVTNPACPGNTTGGGTHTLELTLCRGCCYRVKDPGPDGMGQEGVYTNSGSNGPYYCVYEITIPSNTAAKPATVFLKKDKFKLQTPKKDLTNCPNDHLKIKKIDETMSPATGSPLKFPNDYGDVVNEIKTCGEIDNDYTYTVQPNQVLKIEFKANVKENFKGFVADVCAPL